MGLSDIILKSNLIILCLKYKIKYKTIEIINNIEKQKNNK